MARLLTAYAQNAGQLVNIDEWSPTRQTRKWLLLSGASDPPRNIYISARRPREKSNVRSGKFLHGISSDLYHMEHAVGANLKNTVRNLDITKKEATQCIRKFLTFCWMENHKPMLYYTGHGEQGSGNWCFADGTIGIEEIFAWHMETMEFSTICSDTCYSGKWVEFCAWKKKPGFHCLSACGPYQTALDTGKVSSKWVT